MTTSEKESQVKRGAAPTKRQCMYAGAFFLVALLLVVFGFWKTLFIAVLTAVGAFMGSTDNVGDSVKQGINKAFPPAQKVVTYTAEEIEKVKKALTKKDHEPAADETPGDAAAPADEHQD